MTLIEATGGPVACSRCGLFAGSGRSGEQRIGLVEVSPEGWLALEQVLVPLWVQERARALSVGERQ